MGTTNNPKDAHQGSEMPNNRDSEETIIGSILINPSCLLEVRSILQSDDFFMRRNGMVYDAICELADNQTPPDLILIDEKLQGTDYGGPAYLTKLMSNISSSLNAVAHAELVHELGTRRRMINAAGNTVRLAYNKDKDIHEVTSEAQSALMEAVMTSNGHKGPQEMTAALKQHVDYVSSVQSGSITAISSGLTDYDKILIGGFKPTTLNVIAARTGLGKTATLCTLAKNIAMAGHVPAIFSLEQPTAQVISRLIAHEARIDVSEFDKVGSLSPAQLQSWVTARNSLAKVKLYIDDTPGVSVMYIVNEMRRLKIQSGIDIVLIDYLQLIHPSKSQRMRYLEIQDILTNLHAAARELDIPIVVTAQISRDVDLRADHRPVMKDLRESGDIEAFAYTITFLHRDDFFDPNVINKNIAELIVAKHRQGPTGTAQVIWRGEYSRLENAVFQTVVMPQSVPVQRVGI